MSLKLQPVRGTQDILPEQCRAFRYIDQTGRHLASRFGYEEIITPIFEFSDVFHRTLGESSDVVSKETYTFTDRGGEELTLRPEGTAGIARAFISNGLAQNLPLKFYYSGPMFRYERPQKGRYRQFHQVGVECLGFETPTSDVECIAVGAQFLAELGLQDKVRLEINSLGDSQSRAAHRDRLVDYLSKYEAELSPDSQIRLKKNPLRILDSKDEGDRKLLAEAPTLESCMNEDSKKFFDQVLHGLSVIGLEPHLNRQLVRGLDYYTHSVFEFTTPHLGAQSTVLAGGRYNGLIALMGGPATPGVGWASGVERLALLIDPAKYQTNEKLLALLPAEDRAEDYCLKLAFELRKKTWRVELLSGGNVGKRMKKADKLGATHAVIVGGNELDSGTLMLKNLATGEQRSVTDTELARALEQD